MSKPVEIPIRPDGESPSPNASPYGASPKSPIYHLPSPLPTKRTRTYSASERAQVAPWGKGCIKSFCREKGHGFVLPEDNSEPLFVHISDVEGDFVPKKGDDVKFKKVLIPPKMEKYQAVHVQIVHPVEGVKHERWDSPVERSPRRVPPPSS